MLSVKTDGCDAAVVYIREPGVENELVIGKSSAEYDDSRDAEANGRWRDADWGATWKLGRDASG